MAKQDDGLIFHWASLEVPKAEILQHLKWLEAHYSASDGNAVFAWEALAALLGDGSGEHAIPPWVLGYLREAALAIREISARLDPRYAPPRAMKELGFTGRGRNAFARRVAIQRMRHRLGEYLRLQEEATKRGLTAGAALELIARHDRTTLRQAKANVAEARRYARKLNALLRQDFCETTFLADHRHEVRRNQALATGLKQLGLGSTLAPRLVPTGSKDAGGARIPRRLQITFSANLLPEHVRNALKPRES